jgi:hypothetical protein
MLTDCLYLLIDWADLWNTSWAGVVFLASATAMLFGLSQWAGRGASGDLQGLGWPLHPHARAYWWRAGTVLAVLTYGGALAAAWWASGDAKPLPYVPLLNPIDLTVGLAIAALAHRRQMLMSADPQPRLAAWIAGNGGLGALALLGFVAVNGMWVRTAHHFMDVPWDYTTLSSPTADRVLDPVDADGDGLDALCTAPRAARAVAGGRWLARRGCRQAVVCRYVTSRGHCPDCGVHRGGCNYAADRLFRPPSAAQGRR